jgi:hypothetical protein
MKDTMDSLPPKSPDWYSVAKKANAAKNKDKKTLRDPLEGVLSHDAMVLNFNWKQKKISSSSTFVDMSFDSLAKRTSSFLFMAGRNPKKILSVIEYPIWMGFVLETGQAQKQSQCNRVLDDFVNRRRYLYNS